MNAYKGLAYNHNIIFNRNHLRDVPQMRWDGVPGYVEGRLFHWMPVFGVFTRLREANFRTQNEL